MNKPLIFGIGEIVWDCLPAGKKLGGAPVNFSYYAGRLGADSYAVSAVGKDSLGEETLESCRSFGLDTRFIEQNELPTSRVLVKLDSSGVPQYEILEGVAWDALDASEEVLAAGFWKEWPGMRWTHQRKSWRQCRALTLFAGGLWPEGQTVLSRLFLL